MLLSIVAGYNDVCWQRVPKEALQQRMVIEGLDPNVLEWVV